MKKLTSLIFASVAIFALSGCGDSGSGGNDNNSGGNGGHPDNGGGGGNIYNDVYLTDLEQGYSIRGYNTDNETIELVYCGVNYDYSRDSEFFRGTFFIDYDEVEMSDNNGGSYVLNVDTYDNSDEPILISGQTYACPSLGRNLTVDQISRVNCN
jgi:hypothetical protein